MYKSLMRRPLTQAMALLWAYGFVRLSLWLLGTGPTPKWAVTAGAAAVVLMLIGARLRSVSAVPGWVLIALASVLGAAYLGGVETSAGLAMVAVVVVAALWSVMLGFLASPVSTGLLGLAGFTGGYAPPGGRYGVERAVYWTGLAVVLFCLMALLTQSTLTAPAHSVPLLSLPLLLLAFAYVAAGGHRYRFAFNTYVAAALVVLGAAAVFELAMHPTTPLRFYEAPTGALLAFCAGLALSAAAVAARAGERRNQNRRYAKLYSQPLRIVTGVLSLLAMWQALVVANTRYVGSAGPGWLALITFAAASAILLLLNRQARRPALTVVAALGMAFAAVWFYSGMTAQTPALGMWPGGPAGGDQWLVGAIATLALAIAGSRFTRDEHARIPFGLPLLGVAVAGFAWTLSGALLRIPNGDSWVAGVIAVLIGTLFPLSRHLRSGAQLRGVGTGLLLSLCVVALLGPAGLATYGAETIVVWAFALWFGATFVLPAFNKRLPEWAVAPQTWPWLGLAILPMGLLLGMHPNAMPWSQALIASAYLFLMLRHTSAALFAWLAVGTLTLGVVLASVGFYGSAQAWGPALASFGIWQLVWANLLLLGVPIWRRFGTRINSGLGLRDHKLAAPMLCFAGVICIAWLAAMLFWDAALLMHDTARLQGLAGVALLGTVLAATALHLNLRWPTRLATHLLIAATLAALIAAWGIAKPVHPALVLALFAGLIATTWAVTRERIGALGRGLHNESILWLFGATAASVLAGAAYPTISTIEYLSTVAILMAAAAYVGWRKQSALWVYAGAALAALLLHGAATLWIKTTNLNVLLPIYALQFALLTWGLRLLTLRARAAADDAQGDFNARMLGNLTLAAAAIGLMEFLLHLGTVIGNLLAGQSLVNLTPQWAQAAALATPMLLGGLCVVESRRSAHDKWFYSAAALFAVAAVYTRLMLFGVAPPGVWDSAAIMTASYGMFALHAVTKSRAALTLTLWLPLAALLTVPFQLGSSHTTLTLFSMAALYLLARRSTGMTTPMYLALLTANAGIYLWIPGWAGRSNLLQVYLLPAALSVLFLVHLHRKEIKRSVANGVRLAAMSTLYAVATLDVFLQESLWVFALALGISIAGIALGVVTRTRAFLYAGVGFLVINVLGQLLQLYPEQRLGRAVLLMALGAGVTALMIWFNLKREIILQRIRIARSDLAEWD